MSDWIRHCEPRAKNYSLSAEHVRVPAICCAVIGNSHHVRSTLHTVVGSLWTWRKDGVCDWRPGRRSPRPGISGADR